MGAGRAAVPVHPAPSERQYRILVRNHSASSVEADEDGCRSSCGCTFAGSTAMAGWTSALLNTIGRVPNLMLAIGAAVVAAGAAGCATTCVTGRPTGGRAAATGSADGGAVK